jgi:hypothetical protein
MAERVELLEFGRCMNCGDQGEKLYDCPCSLGGACPCPSVCKSCERTIRIATLNALGRSPERREVNG